MKVLQILPAMDYGGVSRSTLELSKALVKEGHESVVVSSGGDLTSRLTRDGGTHITLAVKQKKLSALRQIKPLKNIISTHQPDIIHLRARMPAWITHMALKTLPQAQKPIIVSTVHSIYPATRYSQSILKADHVICVSDYVQQHLHAHFPRIADTQHSRIYRGIDPKAYPYLYQPSVHWWNNILAEFPTLENKIWLTLVGSVVQSKGHQWLLDIIGGLKEDYPNIHAVIIGEPKHENSSYFEELQLRVNALGLSEYVTFTGQRDDLKEWLAVSNIVLAVDTKPRSFGRTILEAVSMGTPVLAWRQGGVAEILSQLYPAGLIEKEDCLALCAAVRDHLEAPKENPKRPEKSHEFLLKTALQETLSLYKKLLAEKTTA